MSGWNSSKSLFLVLLLLFLVCLPIFCSDTQVVITQNELNELENTLRIADEQLTQSKTEITNLNNLLNGQGKELTMLKTELDKALTLLKKSENEIRFDWLKLVLVGVGACAVGCVIGFVVRGSK